MKWLNLIPQRLDRGATPTFAGLLAGDGTAAAPSISFAAQTNMGFYRIGAGDLGVSVLGAYSFIFGGGGTLYGANGTARLTMPAAGSIGLVAAGTNQNITLTPSGTGQVSHIGLSNFSDTLFFGNSSGSYGRITWGSALTFQAGAGLPFTLVSSNGTEVARGFANGRFGIGTGTTDSGALLQIGNDSSVISGGMVFGTNTFFYRRGDGILGIGHATLPQLYLTDPSGNVFGFVLGTTNLLRLGGNGASGQTRIDSGGAQACIFDTAQGATFANSVTLTAGNLTSANLTGYAIKDSVGTSRYAIRSFTGNVLQIGETGGWTNTTLYANGALALTLGASQTAIFAGAVRLSNAYVAGAVVGTGYVTIQDSTGTTYRVPVLV